MFRFEEDSQFLIAYTGSSQVTEQLIRDVFGIGCRIIPDPVTGTTLIVPIGRADKQVRPEFIKFNFAANK